MKRPTQHTQPLPKPLRNKTISVIGAGKVGCAVATVLHRAGIPIAAVTSRSIASAERAARQTGGEAGIDNAAAAAKSNIVLITTCDDSVADVVNQIADAEAFTPDKLVVHMSGALSLSVLSPASEAGALIGCIHPLQSFASAEDAMHKIRGSVFGITAGPGANETLEALVEVLGGRPIPVEDDCKTLYHAAAVMASNYLVAVEDMAVHLLERAGFEKSTALEALQPLMAGSLENIRKLGTTNALTGPIVRGDVDTVRKHLEALQNLPSDELQMYRTLGLHALEIAGRRQTLDAETFKTLHEILSQP